MQNEIVTGMHNSILKVAINQAFKRTLYVIHFEAAYRPNYATQRVAENSEAVLGNRVYTATADMIVTYDMKELFFRHIIIEGENVYFCFTEDVGAGEFKQRKMPQSVLYQLLEEKRLFADYDCARKKIIDVIAKTKAANPPKKIWYSEGEIYNEGAKVVE